MKKAFTVLLLSIIIFTAGCSPFVLGETDTIELTGDEPLHLRSADPIPEPVYETSVPAEPECIEELFSLTNEYRKSHELSEFSLSTTLCSIAQLRAVDMAENDYFAHISPGGEKVCDILQEYNVFYFSVSENIGKGTVSCKRMMDTWMNSPDHRAIILNRNYHQLGIGIAESGSGETYWVQVFTN